MMRIGRPADEPALFQPRPEGSRSDHLALDASSIKYEVKGDGSTLFVDRDKVALRPPDAVGQRPANVRVGRL